MSANLLQTEIGRRLLTLVVAVGLALSAAYAPVLLDGLAGSALTPVTMACQGQGGSGGCG